MSRCRSLKRLVMLVVAGAVVGLAATGAQATTYTWDDNYTSGDGLWATNTNWNEWLVPGTADTARFSDFLNAPGAISLNGTTQTIGAISLENAGGAYTIGAGTLALTSGLVQQKANVTGVNTISTTVSGGALNFAIGGGTLNVTGPITGTTLTKGGAGTLGISNVATLTGATTVNAGSLILSGAGVLGGTTGITVNATGSLILDNTSAGSNGDRVPNVGVTLNGGRLALYGGTESVANVTFGNGNGISRVSASAGSTLTIGAINDNNMGGDRAAGFNTAADFSGPGTIVTTAGNTNGILGRNLTFNNGQAWAAVNGGNIVAYTGATPMVATGANGNTNYVLTDSLNLTAPQNINTLTISNTAVGTLDFQGNQQTGVWPILFNGTADYTITTNGSFMNTNSIVFNNWSSSNLIVSGTLINGAGYGAWNGPGTTIYRNGGLGGGNSGFYINGGTLKMAFSQASNKPWTITAGTLDLSDTSGAGTSISISALTLNAGTVKNAQAGGTLTMGGDVTATSGVNVISTTNLILGAARTFTVNGEEAYLNISSQINGGAQALTKAGTGTLILSHSANTGISAMTLNNGVLRLANSTGSSLGAANLTINGGVLSSGPTGAMTGTVTATATASAYTISPGGSIGVGILTVGSLALTSSATLDFMNTTGNAAGTNMDQLVVTNGLTFAGAGTARIQVPYNLNDGSYLLINAGAGSTDMVSGNYLALQPSVPSGYTLRWDAAGNDLYLDVAANVYWQGASVAPWNSTSSWGGFAPPNAVGATAIFKGAGGSLVEVDAPTTVGKLSFTSTALSYTIRSTSGNFLTFQNKVGSPAQIAMSVGTVAQTISAQVQLASDLKVKNDSASALTISGNISESGGSRALNVDSGLLVLSGTGSSYTGITTVGSVGNTATLRYGNVNSAAPGSIVTTVSGGLVDLNAKNQIFAGLAGTSGTVFSGGPAVLTINQSGTSTYGGAIAGIGLAVIKSGSGTLTLTNNNTYGNGTTLNGGVLNFSNSGLGTGAVTINGGRLTGTGTASNVTLNGGTLGGTLTLGAVTAGTGPHVISPGDTAGGAIHTGTLTLNNNTLLDFSNLTSGNQIISSGLLNFSGTGAAQVTVPTGLFIGTYSLINFTSTSGSATASNFAVAGGLLGYSFAIDNTTRNLNLVVAGNSWKGATSTNWNAASGWSLSSIPNGAGATAVFTGSGGTTVIVDQATMIGSMQFASTASYSINGPSALTFNNNGADAHIYIGSATTAYQTIRAPVVLQGNLVISSSGTNVQGLIFRGGITESGGSYGLRLTAGTVQLGAGTGNGGPGNWYSGDTVIAGTGVLRMGNTGVGGSYALSPNSTLVTMDGGRVDLFGQPQAIPALSGNGGTIDSPATTADFTVNLADGRTSTYGGMLGNINLIKSGNGTLILTGTSNANFTTINQGVLQMGVNQALGATPTLTINPGGTLALGGFGLSAGSNLRLNGGTISGPGTMTLSANIVTTGGTFIGGALALSGSITATIASGTLTIAEPISSGSLIKDGPGTLLLANTTGTASAFSSMTINAGLLKLGAANQFPNGSSLILNGTYLDMAGFDTSVGPLTLSSGTVFSSVGTPAFSVTGGITSTGTSRLPMPNLNVGAAAHPVFNVTNGTLTIDGAILNGGTVAANGIQKTGEGTLVLMNTASQFISGTEHQLNGGTVVSGASEVLGGHLGTDTTALNMSNNAAWNVNGTYQALLGLTGAVGNSITLNGGTVALLNGGTARTYGGTIVDGTSAGTLVITLTGAIAQTFTGNLSPSRLILQSGNVTGTGNVTNSTIELNAGTLGMNIVGTATVNKISSGIAVLGGTNLYSGPTTVVEGAVEFTGTAAWSPNSNVSLAGGAVQVYSTAATSLALNLGTAGGQLQFTSSGGGIAARGAKLTLTFNGGSALQWGTTPGLSTIGFGSTTATAETELTNAIDLGGGIRTIIVLDNPAVTTDFGTISGAITGGGIVKDGAGTLYITSTDNAFTGGVTVNSGILRLNSAGTSLPAGNAVTVTGGTLDVQAAIVAVTSLTVSGGGVTGTGAISSNTINLQNGMVSVGLLGAGGVNKITTGTVTLTRSSGYTGVTNIAGGTLIIQNPSALGSAADGTTVAIGATLAIQGGYSVAEPLTLSGAGVGGTTGALQNLSGINAFTGGITLATASTVNVADGILTLSGPISGSASITKIGAGLLVISGTNNSYTGGTVVTGGTLSASGKLGGNATAQGGTLQIMPGFTLSSTGKVIAGPAGTVELYTDLGYNVQFGGGSFVSYGNRTISGGTLTDAGNASFFTNGRTLTIAPNLTFAGDRIWTVGDNSTVVLAGNIIGAGRIFTKLGNGTLVVQGTSNLSILNIGEGLQPGGIVVGNSALAGTAGVTIAPASLYTIQQANYAYNEVAIPNSGGVLALSRSSNVNYDFSSASGGLYLGVYDPAGGVVTYTGHLTPNVDLIGGYLVGGGKGILDLNTVLADAFDSGLQQVATNLTVGYQPGSQNPLPQGMVRLSATNTLTGFVDVYGNLQFGTATALNSATSISIRPGGTFDLNNTGYDAAAAVLAGKLLMQPDGVAGGSIANTNGSLGQALLATLFPDGYAYQVGGGGTGVTTVENGGLLNLGATVKDLIKQGSSVVVLAGGTNNTFSGSTTVNDGTLRIPDITALATTSGIQVNGNASGMGVLEFTGSGSLTQTIALAGSGTVRVATGNTISVPSLNLTSSTATSAILDGGGTLAVTGSAGVTAAGGNVLNITGSTTLDLPWAYSAVDPGNRLVVQDTGVLRFSSNTSTSGGIGNSIGTLMPGGTLQLTMSGATLALNRGTVAGLVLDVVQSSYPELGTLAFSSTAKPYTIDTGNNTLRIGSPGVMTLQTAAFMQGSVLHTPVAYIQKNGPGTLEMWQPMLQITNTAAAANVSWVVNAGTLSATTSGGDTSLGATAPAYFGNNQTPLIAGQHLENMYTKANATLVWGGAQGSLPASVYGGLAAGNGNGFNYDEFVFEGGSTLRGLTANPLVAGWRNAATGTDYGLPVTIVSSTSAAAFNMGGNVTLRSGTRMTSGGTVALNILNSGNVTLKNDIGGYGYDSVRSLTLQGGSNGTSTASVDASFTNVQTTTVQDGSVLNFNPGTGASITHGGSVVNNGTVHVQTGSVNMGTGIISSTNPTLGVATVHAGLLAGNLAGRQNITDANPGTTSFADLSYFSTYNATSSAVLGPNGTPLWTYEGETWVLTGQFLSTGGTYTFAENFDDTAYLKIDNTLVFSNGAYNQPSKGTITLTAGWHDIDIRLGNDGIAQGVGPTGNRDNWAAPGLDGMAIGMDTLGRDAYVSANFTNIPAALFQYLATSATLGAVTIDAGSNLSAGGFSNLGLVSVQGDLTLVNTGTNSTLGMSVNGGTFHANNTMTVSSSSGIGVSNATFDVAGSRTLTLTGSLSDVGSSAGIAKTGAGLLILPGTSTYTGPTTINQGELRVPTGGTLASIVTVASGGTGAISGAGHIGGLNLNGGTVRPGDAGIGTMFITGNATLAGGAAYEWQLASATSASQQDLLSITGTLNLTASSTSKLTINMTALGLADFTNGGIYHWLIASAGSITGFDVSGASYQINAIDFPFTPTGSFSLSQVGGGLYLNYQGASVQWVWQGLSTDWANNLNWENAELVPTSADRVVFDAMKTIQPTITGSASAFAVDFRSGDWHISGTGADLYINAGGLTSTSTAAATNTIDPNVTLLGSQTWTTSAGNIVVLNGAMNLGGNTLTKDGLGTLKLSGTGGTGGGTLAVNEGLVQATTSNVLGDGVTLAVGGGTYDLQATSDTIDGLSLNGGSVLGSGTLTLNTSAYLLSGTVQPRLAGGANVTKSGGGSVTLSGAGATYTGATNIAQGTLVAGAINVISSASAVTVSGTLNMAGFSQIVASIAGGTSGSIQLGSGTLTAGDSTSTAFDGIIAGSGGAFVKTGSGTLTLNGSSNAFSGGTTVQNGTLRLGATGALPTNGNLILGGVALDMQSYNATVGLLTLNSGSISGTGSATLTASAFAIAQGTVNVILAGSANMTKSTGGTLSINTPTAHTGATDIQDGIVSLGTVDALSSSSSVTVGGSASLVMNGNSQTVKSIGGAGIISLSNGTLTEGSGNLSTTSSGQITGPGGGALVKTGTGDWNLANALNTFSGPVSIRQGSVTVATSGALGDGTSNNNLLLGGGGGGALLATGSFSTGRSVAVTGTGNSINVASSQAVTFSGAFSIGAGGTFAKTGPGSLALGNAGTPATYGIGSSLAVNAGTLTLASPGGDNNNRNLAVTVNNSTLVAGSTQYLSNLSLTNSGRASINAVGTGIQSRTVKVSGGTGNSIGLSITGGSLLDIKDNNLVVNYTNDQTGSQLQAVLNMVKSGGGTKSDAAHYDWNGTNGITTSSITGNSGTTYTNMNLALGIRDLGFDLVNRPAPAAVEGVTVESGTASGTQASIVVMYTWIGDMDLDGKVTVNDYLEFLQYYAAPPSNSNYRTWMTGDFNYDGLINVNDYLLLLAGYANQGSPLAGNEEITDTMWQTGLDLVTTTPEPATLALLAVGAGLALVRRRRRS